MNWYKFCQIQPLLFYPWQKKHDTGFVHTPISEVIERQIPSFIDQFGKKFYRCTVCNNLILEDEVEKWHEHPTKKHEYMHPYNLSKEQLVAELTILVDAIQQYMNMYERDISIKQQEEADSFNERIFMSEWKTPIYDIKSVLGQFKELKNFCDFFSHTKNFIDYWSAEHINKICLLFDKNEIDAYDIRYFQINDVPEEIANDMNRYFVSNRELKITVLSPICESCMEDVKKCHSCDKILLDPTEEGAVPTIWDKDEYICRTCLEMGDYGVCDECGKADESRDMHYSEDLGYLCENCVKNMHNYDFFYSKIEDIAKDNPKPFDTWFEGEDRVYIPLEERNYLYDIDKKIKRHLEENGCISSNIDYKDGYCYFDNRKFRIVKFLERLRKARIKELRESDPYIDDIDKFYKNLIKQFSESESRTIKKRHGLLVVISQNPHDIAQMSFARDWTSCMDLARGSHAEDVYCEVEGGGLIAYLINHDDRNIEHPLGRVLIRRYVNKDGKSLAIPETIIYGNAPKEEFLGTINNWLNAHQKDLPSGVYELEGMSYSETLNSHIEHEKLAKLIAEQILKISREDIGMIKTAGNITWKEPSDFNQERDIVIDISVSKLDSIWRNNEYSLYVGKYGTEYGNPQKYESLDKLFKSDDNIIVEMPRIAIGDDGFGKQMVGFIDGRHRFSVFRDHGGQIIPVVIPKKQFLLFKKIFAL